MILMYVILFVTLAVGILFGSHYLLYFSIVNIFSVTSSSLKYDIAIVISGLAVSFILATFLTMWKENIVTRFLYFVSAFWLGILVNLLLAITALSVVILVGQLADFDVNMLLWGSIFFALAAIYSLRGLWNAMHPQIKNLSIIIPGLPDGWKNKKVIQLSDVHLGHVYREGFLRGIVDKINAEKPEMVVITGDLFDGMDGDLAPLAKPLDDIEAKEGIFFVTGNHETYLGVKEVTGALARTKVKIMKDEVIDLKGLRLIGINYPDWDENKDVVKVLGSLEKSFRGYPNIFLYHSPVHIDQFKESGVNLQLSGHTHYGQIFPVNYITRFIYGGYDYGLYQMDDYTLYTTNGAGTWGPTMRTGNIPEIVSITLK